MAIQLHADTHVGHVRANNEDSYFYGPIPNNDTIQMAMVSDGVGGKKHGEVASDITKNVLSKLLSSGKLDITKEASTRGPMLDMSARRAHQEIADAAKATPEYTGMACTLVALIADSQNVGWVSVGDSRIYHWKNGILTQINEDQTVAQVLFREGRITQDDLATHPDRNTLQYCLGLEAINAPIEPQSGNLNWNLGDKLLLCSDGLTDMVSEPQICDVLSGNDVNNTVGELIGLALENGGKDNITVVVLENVED